MDKELKRNIEKIKQSLTLLDYDKIDKGVELAINFEEPKIFEYLLNGCTIDFTIEGGYEHAGTGGLSIFWSAAHFICN